MHGKGKIIFKSGEIQEGFHKNNEKHGDFKIITPNGNIIYTKCDKGKFKGKWRMIRKEGFIKKKEVEYTGTWDENEEMVFDDDSYN